MIQDDSAEKKRKKAVTTNNLQLESGIVFFYALNYEQIVKSQKVPEKVSKISQKTPLYK